MAIEFTPEDRDRLSVYLNKNKFKLLAYLRTILPKVESKTFEAMALEGKERKGAEDLIAKIEELGTVEKRQSGEEPYYDITKDIPR